MYSISFKFFPNLRTQKGKLCKIYGRLIINRKKVEFSTRFSIDLDLWNAESNSPKKNISLKQELVEIEQKVYRIIRKFEDNEIHFTPKEVVDVLKNRGNRFKPVKVLDYFNQFNQEMKDKGQSATSTLRHYAGTYKILDAFLKKSKKTSMLVSDINYRFIKDLDYYMNVHYTSPTGEKIVQNTINKHHARFRAIINAAIKEGLVHKNPYTQFGLKFKRVEREKLDQSELDNIQALDLSDNRSLDKIRDIFLFSCNTGLRFQDAQDMVIDNVKDFKNGAKYIEIQMGKTKEIVSVPLTTQAISIIEKYNDYPDRIVQRKILPSISNQKFNVFMDVIRKMAGIDKTVTHHIARHTFATIALNKGINIVVVQKLLGHTTVKTTEIYAKMLEETIFNEMKKME